MPTYHIHDTAVKLYAWDPHQPPKFFIEPWTYPLDPSYGRDKEALKEEQFLDHDGVEFLGSDMPFFLVKSGRDLFFKTRQTSTTTTKHAGAKIQEERFLFEKTASISDILPIGPQIEARSPADDFEDDEDDSALSSISSSMFADSSPPRNEENVPQNTRSGEIGKRGPRGWCMQKPKSNPQDTIYKPITTAVPIMVQLELSKKSFVKSIITNDAQDLCINIFINGDFAQSKIIQSGTAILFTAEEKDQPFGGRRVDKYLEVPWVVLPVVQDSTSLSEEVHESPTFESRWDKVNQLLLRESDEWGRTGKFNMFRSPVGEFLAELSKRPVPQGMRKCGTKGRHAGIIDVVISFGKSVTIPDPRSLTMPHRKLSEGICGKNQQLVVVSEELKRCDKARIIADFEREETSRGTGLFVKENSQIGKPGDGYYFSMVASRNAPLSDSADDSDPAETTSAGQAMGPQEEPSSSQPLALIISSAQLKRGGPLPVKPSPMSQQRTGTKAIPTYPTRERSRHPNKPKVTPQKSYKGLSPSPQGQKQNPWEFIPFDSEQSVVSSTRSKRSKPISASSPDNLRGQELVDNYLTLRNRQFGSLPSTPIDHFSGSTTSNDGLTFTPGVSSEMESNPCRRSSTRSDQRSNCMLQTSGDAINETEMGLDGADDARKRKRKSGTSMRSENMPARSSKRKWAPSGSPNTSLGSGESPPVLPPRSVKRGSIGSKDNKVSGHSVRTAEQGPNPPMRDMKYSQPQEFFGPQEKSITSQPQEPAKKTQRRPSRAISARELSSLLTPHKPAMSVNTSFDASFAEPSSTRLTRNPAARQAKVPSVPKAENPQANSPKVTATYKKPVLAIKGVRRTIQKTMTHTPAFRNTTSEPPPYTNESKKAKRTTAKGRVSKVQAPEQAVSNNVKWSQEKVETSMNPVETTMKSVKTQGQKIASTQTDAKVQSGQLRDNSAALPMSYGDFWRDFKAPLETPELGLSMSTKPNPGTDLGAANALSSNPHQKVHRGMNTPTSQRVTSTVPNGMETSNTLMHTLSSSATMKYTPGTGGTMFFPEAVIPTLAMPVPPSTVGSSNPSTKGSLVPPPKLIQSSCLRGSASIPSTVIGISSMSAPRSMQSLTIPVNLVPHSNMRRSSPGPFPSATSNPTGSSVTQQCHPPKPSDSTDQAWQPNSLCTDSVLSYANEQTVKSWLKWEYVSQAGLVHRASNAEKEAVFRASGILMGVRFVLGVGGDE